jgi:hypothetical protein
MNFSSYFLQLKSSLIERLIQLPGWRTKSKIIVLESDDWGMIRMSSKESYNYFQEKGYRVDLCPYNKYDSLESDKDVEYLLDVLNSVRDAEANPSVLTLNNVVGNPNFEKIKKDNYTKYFWEPFTETLNRNQKSLSVFSLYIDGVNNKLIKPQFHGREHIGIHRWLKALQLGSRKHLDAFEHNMYSITDNGKIESNSNFLNAFAPEESFVFDSIENRIFEGLNYFENIWGFKSESVIAPCYTWDNDVEKIFLDNGVKVFQGNRTQIIRSLNPNFKKIKYHFTGQKNMFGQIYLIRNVKFEPFEKPNEDSVNLAMKQIDLAFKYQKPAIIGTHRANYIGSLVQSNRDNNLKKLSLLLKSIIAKWPDVIFMSSDQLGKLIIKEDEC